MSVLLNAAADSDAAMRMRHAHHDHIIISASCERVNVGTIAIRSIFEAAAPLADR